jgi:hypothetical protein
MTSPQIFIFRHIDSKWINQATKTIFQRVMVFFDEMETWEDILVYDEVGLLHVDGRQTKGRLILTQMRLVFVIGGDLSRPIQKTEHIINMKSIEKATLVNSEILGVILRVDFTTSVGSHVVRYLCHQDQAERFAYHINERADMERLGL